MNSVTHGITLIVRMYMILLTNNLVSLLLCGSVISVMAQITVPYCLTSTVLKLVTP